MRRLELRFGKMGVNDFFDINDVGTDSHLQFMNWTVDNNGAFDYAADTRGYTIGLLAEYHDRNWAFRFEKALMPKVANGIDLQWDLYRARAENYELELHPSVAGNAKYDAASAHVCESREHGRVSRRHRQLSGGANAAAGDHGAPASRRRSSTDLDVNLRAAGQQERRAYFHALDGTKGSTNPSRTPKWTRRSRWARTFPVNAGSESSIRSGWWW